MTKKEIAVLKDYPNATLHLLWHRKDKIRTIVFALIELLPTEYPKTPDCDERNIKLSSKHKGEYLHFKRITRKSKTLIEWYKTILKQESRITILGQKDGEFLRYNYKEDVPFPILSISNDLPYVYGFDNTVRHSNIYNLNFPEHIKKALLTEKGRVFIRENISFNISYNLELIGSINIIAYDPLIRNIKLSLTQFNTVSVNIEPRDRADISKLKYIQIEKRLGGLCNLHEINVNDFNFEISSNNNSVEAIAYAIICPERGLLRWFKFSHFFKSYSLNIGIQSGKKHINCKKSYVTDIIDEMNNEKHEPTSIYDSDSVHDFLLHSKQFNSKMKELESPTQKIFYNNPNEATTFVRGLVARAKVVTFVDPYFCEDDILSFACSVTNKNAKITILTSFKGINSEEKKHIASQLQQKIQDLKKVNNIDILIMSDNNPAFHDRFIIINDSTIWLSGTSFNSIGTRVSVLVKLEAPEQVFRVYKHIIDNECKSLQQWINEKTSSTT